MVASTKECGVGNTPVKLTTAEKNERNQAADFVDKDFKDY